MTFTQTMDCVVLLVMSGVAVSTLLRWMADAQIHQRHTRASSPKDHYANPDAADDIGIGYPTLPGKTRGLDFEIACPITSVDQACSFSPAWVLVYTGFFLTSMCAIVVVIRSSGEMVYFLGRMFLVTFIHLGCYALKPSTLPEPYLVFKQEHDRECRSHVLMPNFALFCLALFQRYDGDSTMTVPSLHSALSALEALVLYYEYGVPGWQVGSMLFLMVFSALKIKQHVLYDCLLGVGLSTVLYPWL
jgi:hypothetical protein